jgi:hypothetical protein
MNIEEPTLRSNHEEADTRIMANSLLWRALLGHSIPTQIFSLQKKIESDDFFTVCSLCIDHALCEISDF